MNKINHKLPKEFVKKLKATIRDKKSLEGELLYTTGDGTEEWYQNSVMPILDDDGTHIGEVVVRYDITDKKLYEKLAVTDPLTQLYNRRHFNDVLSREINNAKRKKSVLSFIILDVDYFKKYNDSYGHKAGDEALIAVSKTLKESLHRGSDYAFRLGGEEFGIIFLGENASKSFAFAEKIRSNIEALNIKHSNSEVANHLTVSIGLLFVDFSTENINSDGFYTMADSALYVAKNNGRNRVHLHENDTFEMFS